MPLTLTSPDFFHNREIPTRFTCEGSDVSPALEWDDAPKGTQSFALIVDDPDAPDPAKPQRTYVHWVLYNIPPDARRLPAEVEPSGQLPSGTEPGMNDWDRTGYGGPCPPKGRHRYFFKLYALDTLLPDLHRPRKADLEQAMKGHVLDQAEIIGTYQKKGT